MGHLINPTQFRLGHSVYSDRNWPALNKEQYMFCYGIQKDFTDYFKSIFLFKKKLILKRKHRKRRFFTKNKNPRLLFSHCNVNFFGFNLNRVLVDVNIFDLRFESKWESLFDNKRFQNFLFNFSQVFRTAKILRIPTFFVNIKKETIKHFFAILNVQYHKINGTLLSQTTKWVKSYLSKIYQKFFSFFTDSAYLVNKRKALRQAKRYIKKRSAKAHLFITSKYKKRQKRIFLRNWSKILLLLSPISAKFPSKFFQVKNKKKISKLKKMLLIKNKYLFNFFDMFDLYFKVIAHKFAKKVRRRDLSRFYSLVESAKIIDYLKSIKKDFKFSLRRLSFNKPILSLIPLEDKIRLYKSQAHYYLKNIILKKQFSNVDRYIKLIPAVDLDKKIMKKFYNFKKDLALIENKVNVQAITKKPYTRSTVVCGLNTFLLNVKTLLSLIQQHKLKVKSLINGYNRANLLYPAIRFEANNENEYYTKFFTRLISEFTIHRNKKIVVNKNLLKFIKTNFYKLNYTYKNRLFKENLNLNNNRKKIVNKKNSKNIINKKPIVKSNKKINLNSRPTKFIPYQNKSNKFFNRNPKPYTRTLKKYPIARYTLLSNFKLKSSDYKNILKNWVIYEGNFWVERLISHLVTAVRYSEQKKYNEEKLNLIKGVYLPQNKQNNDRRIAHVTKAVSGLNYMFIKRRDLIWEQNDAQSNYFKNKLFLFNNMSNLNFPAAHKELAQTLDYSDKREKFLKGSSLPEPKHQYDNDEKPVIELPAFDTDRLYKNFESTTILSNIDPFISEHRSRVNYHYTLDPFFQKYMKLKQLKSLLVNIAVDIGDQKMITAKFLSYWLKSLFKKGRKISYVLRTLDRFIRPSNNYIGAVSVLFVGRFTRSAYTTNKYYKFGRLNNGEILKQMDYDSIEFTTKFGMCGIKVKIQYKVNVFANRNLSNYLKSSFSGSEAKTYKFDENLHLPMLMKYGSKRLFRIRSNLKYKNNIPFYQFK
jgi:hypothetical protein